MTARRASIGWWALVLTAVLAGLVARTWNLDWDERQHLHPDERHWALVAASLDEAGATAGYPSVAGPVLTWLDGQRSPANPYRGGATSFVYGPATLAVARGVAGWLHDGVVEGRQPASMVVHALDALGLPLLDDDGAPRFDTGYQVDLVGRLVGAVADALTIVVVALAARRLVGAAGARRADAAGVIAAWMYAGVVMAIQHAHFLGAEPALALTSALCVLAMLHVDRSTSRIAAARSGVVVGAAAGALVAVKLSGVGLALVPFAALGALVVIHRRRSDVVRVGAAALGAAVAFRVCCPAAFVGLGWRPNPQFWDDVDELRAITRSDWPPSIQWANRTFLVEPAWWLLKFTLGPGLVVAGVAGLVVIWARRRDLGRWPAAVVIAATVVPFVFAARYEVTSGRYFVPLIPALCVAAGVGVASALRWVHGAGVTARRAGLGAIAAVLTLAMWWPLGYLSGVHGGPNTRVVASEWIAANIAPGSTLSAQAWDDALPLAVRGIDPQAYRIETLNSFDPDSVAKIATLADQLATLDYVVESSPRVWDAVVRIPARYPSMITLFEALDDGRLGFERVATFTSPPRIGPWTLEGGEEAFSVYDHPEVRIWQRVEQRTAEQIFAVLDPVAAAGALRVHPLDAAANGGLLTADEVAANDARATFDDAFASGVWANGLVQAVSWLVVLAVLAAATWSILGSRMETLPDAGVGVSMTIGLGVIVAGTVVASGWLGVAYGRSLVAALVGGWVLAGGWIGWQRRDAVVTRWRERRVAIVGSVAVSVIGWCVGLALRAANPDVWHPSRGGEKPFELAMLTSVLRARTIPPPDAWFAGGALNYHYGGSLMVAVPARLVATSPEVALNLGIAMVAMAAAGAAYSLGAVAASVTSTRRQQHLATAPRQSLARRGGVLAALFVLVVPNLAIFGATVRRLRGADGGRFDWWSLSRVVPDSPIITEFPSWSLLFGDLHGHVMAMPVVLAIAVVAIAGVLASTRRDALVLAVLAGVLVGWSRAVNSWDVPLTAAAVAAGGVGCASVRRWRRGVAVVTVAAVTMVVVWRPYTSRVEIGDAGVTRNADPTPVWSAVTQWGLWLAITFVVLAGAVPWRRVASRLGGASRRLRLGTTVVALAIITAVVVSGHVVAAGAALAALGCLAVVASAARDGDRPQVPVVALVVLAFGWAIVAMTEVVVFRGDFQRMNTVFKWWFHGWVLIAAGCAGAVAAHSARSSPSTNRRTRRALVGLGSVAGIAAVAFMWSAVPARLDDRVSTNGASLDGLAVLDTGLGTIGPGGGEIHPGEDQALIEWMRASVRGLPTILEAPGVSYGWSGRVAATTGLPTVIGWQYHEGQQRPSAADAIVTRVADAQRFFGDADVDERLDVLWRRRVELIVFGTAERDLAGAEADSAIRSLPCVEVVFEAGSTFVAAVDQECVAPRAISWSFANRER